MSATFSGSATYMTNSATPITGYPFTVGFWAYVITGGSSSVMFSLADTATSNNYFDLFKTTGGVIQLTANAAGTSSTAATTGTVNTGSWFYVLARFISATSRRLSVLFADGTIENVSNSTSRTPTSIDQLSLGALVTNGVSFSWPGRIAEFWITDSDITDSSGAINDDLFRQIAYHGPFSVPDVSRNLVEYHAMRGTLPIAPNPASYFGKYGFQSWLDPGASVTLLGPHPPLPYEYARSQPVARMLMI